MKHIKHLAMAATLLSLAACSGSSDNAENIIDRPDYKVADNGIFDIEGLLALGRVTNPVVSPDGSKVIYGISYESIEQNSRNNDLYMVDTDGSNPVRLTRTPKSESCPAWIDEGKRIAFLYPDANGKNQIWVMNPDGSARKQITTVEAGIEGFRFSPDQKKVVMISPVKYTRTAADVYPDLPKATGRIIDDLMYKHWDEWVTEIPHPFIGDFDGSAVSNIADIMADEPYEAPMRPFGGIESLVWSPDSQQLIYVSRKKTGMEYAISTNSDLYLYNPADSTTRNLTEGMMGYDTNPMYSPDGKWIAWLSMENDGYESDKNRIMLMNTATGEKTDLTAQWDYTTDEIAWAPDSKSLYLIAPMDGVVSIFNLPIEGAVEPTLVAGGVWDYASLQPLADGRLITMRHSFVRPNEVFAVNGADIKALTTVNDDLFAKFNMPTVEKRLVPTTDGKEMTTWVLLPPGFDPEKKYPAILFCQGGPQDPVSQFWSYRWNFALMASNGYVVIAPNRRGLPGFGTEWNAQISKDYPGQNMRDYLSAVDYMKNEPWIDADRIGAVGASYGAYSVYWLAGNHDNRFACFIAHAGIFNLEAQYTETEEMWFVNWDLGGPFWDKNNAVAQRSFSAGSPHHYVDRWNTPILVTHGELDFRILASQGMQAFNAARLRGIPAEMLIFPDENHWILQPQNAVLWHRVFYRWLDRWLKDEK